MQKTNNIKQFRVLDALYNEIKRIDPGTAISKNLLRTLGLKGEFDTIIVGKKGCTHLIVWFPFLGFAIGNQLIIRRKNNEKTK